MAQHSGLLQGNLELLILKTLSWQPRHGYGIARWLEEVTDDALRIEEGSLYPALYRLQERGLLDADWGVSESGKRIKVYRLSAAGEEELRRQTLAWVDFSHKMSRVLHFAPSR